jgi:hypothetical protein
MSHLTCWLSFGQVGLAQLVRTHGVTTTNFMGFHPIPRSRAYLGASRPWLGVIALTGGKAALLSAFLAVLPHLQRWFRPHKSYWNSGITSLANNSSPWRARAMSRAPAWK